MIIEKTYSKISNSMILKFTLDESDCEKLNQRLVKEFVPREPYFIEGSVEIDDEIDEELSEIIENASDLETIMDEIEENLTYEGMGEITLGFVENSEGDFDISISLIFRPLDIWDKNESSMDNVDSDIFMPMLYDALWNYLVAD